MAFGSDQISAVVLDIGSQLTKAGFAGEDAPKRVFASRSNEDPALEAVGPCSEGFFDQWDVVESLFASAFNQLGVDSSQVPVMFADIDWNTSAGRAKLVEIAFERFGVSGFYLGRSAVLSAFAAGRSTAMVLSSGASSTSCVPVLDGHILKKSIEWAPIGGDYVSEHANEFLSKLGVQVVPRYLVKSKTSVDRQFPAVYQLKKYPHVTQSYHDLQMQNALHEFKESIANVAEAPFDDKILKKRSHRNFEFANGYNTTFGADRYRISESMFQESFQTRKQRTVSELINASLIKCDADIRPVLYSNIVLAGGNTMLSGFADRIYTEVMQAVPGSKPRIHGAGGSSERKFGAWIGGSILASLDNFAPLWISKDQYTEHGATIESRTY